MMNPPYRDVNTSAHTDPREANLQPRPGLSVREPLHDGILKGGFDSLSGMGNVGVDASGQPVMAKIQAAQGAHLVPA